MMDDLKIKKAAIFINGLATVLFSCHGMLYISQLYGKVFEIFVILFSIPLLLWGIVNMYVAVTSKYDNLM